VYVAKEAADVANVAMMVADVAGALESSVVETVERHCMSDYVCASETGVGEFCAPGPAEDQRGVWLLKFEDAQRGDRIYFDESEAYQSFARAESLGWNCYLFVVAKRSDQENINSDGGEKWAF
jgi:uncharacterized lipoprotein YddW (UPF0748 family)